MAFYMKINGIDGNVSAKGHEGWIEVNAIDLSVGRKLDTQTGRVNNRSNVRPQFGEIILTKVLDKASPLLFQSSCRGQSEGTILIHACHTGKALTSYLEYTLENTIISNYESEASGSADGEDSFHEEITLNYTKIEMRFMDRGANDKVTKPIPAGYDLETAQVL